jgi:DNA-binding MarR family transcriptional regulator
MDALAVTSSTAFRLHRATVLIDRLADRYLLTEHGLSYSAFSVLMMISVLDGPTQRQIADNLDVSRASVTQRIALLQRDGLVSVTPDPNDARANRVTLTGEGQERFTRAWQGLEAQQDGLDAGVDEARLGRQLDRVIANALRALDAAVAR